MNGDHRSGSNGTTSPGRLRRVRNWLRALRPSEAEEQVRETLEELIEERVESTEAPIDAHERRLLANILRLREVAAQDVMVPRADIVAVDLSTSKEELVALINDQRHSRYPVFRGTLDDAVGFVHIKDALTLMSTNAPFQLSRIIRRILYVAPSIRVLDLLLEMRLKRTHMALVVDEYGGIDGLITIEDLVEQITGEIEDEHDTDADPDFVARNDGVLEADARVPLTEFEQRVGTIFSEEEREANDTLGGLVSFLAGRMPTRGELIKHASGIEFEIVDADPRRIKRLRVRNLPKHTDRAA
ncbi:MAG TPA: hemolysin family protein [Magnetospirillaceae bacterium]